MLLSYRRRRSASLSEPRTEGSNRLPDAARWLHGALRDDPLQGISSTVFDPGLGPLHDPRLVEVRRRRARSYRLPPFPGRNPVRSLLADQSRAKPTRHEVRGGIDRRILAGGGHGPRS